MATRRRSVATLNSEDQLKRARLLDKARSLRVEATKLERQADELAGRMKRREKRQTKKRWQPPVFDMGEMRRLYRQLYDEPWPSGWSVRWVGWMPNRLGVCDYSDREIRLSYGDLGPGRKHNRCGEGIRVLLHEVVHMRAPKLRHGREFARLVRSAWERLGGDPDQIGDVLGTY